MLLHRSSALEAAFRIDLQGIKIILLPDFEIYILHQYRHLHHIPI